MASISIKYINLQEFTARGSSAAIVVRLMMACNDLSVANEAIGQWKKPQSSLRIERQRGAQLYFARIQIAHLYEGMKVIEAVRNDSYLLSLVGHCDGKTQQSFQHLEQFLTGGAQYNRFISLVEKIRHNVVFH